MNFASVVLFVLGSIGLTHVIVDSAIFAPVRSWLEKWLPSSVYKVFECYQCCGVWVGWFLGALLFGVPEVLAGNYWLAAVQTFVAGFAASFVSYGAAVMLTYFEANSVIPPSVEGEDKGQG